MIGSSQMFDFVAHLFFLDLILHERQEVGFFAFTDC